VDFIYDIGRIEKRPLQSVVEPAAEIIRVAAEKRGGVRVRQERLGICVNTFCFGYRIGYKFIKTRSGDCNGNFLGIGADDCFTALEVEQCSNIGLLISNGEFVSFHGPDPTMVNVGTNNSGSVRFVNSAFWGPCNQIAKIAGKGTVGFSDCTFVQWDRNHEGRHAIQVEGGNLLLRGCEFQEDKPQVEIGPAVRKAVVTENLVKGKLPRHEPRRRRGDRER